MRAIGRVAAVVLWVFCLAVSVHAQRSSGGLVQLDPLPSLDATNDAGSGRFDLRDGLNRLRHTGLAGGGGLLRRGSPPPIEVFPAAGNLYRDLFMGSFVDLDPNSPGLIDFACLDYTRDGHRGIDIGPRWFAEKRIGVPIFAAQDGVVTVTNDGEPDENVNGSASPGNLVFIDHGFGQIGMYYHMANGSISVAVGQQVKAGEQIGLVGSSGNSFGPHLHFELERDGVTYEPFAGPCRPGPSGWAEQPIVDRSQYVWDFGLTHEDLHLVPYWPEPFPREGQLAITDTFTDFWVLGAGLPANSDWRVQFMRPDGTIVFDSFTLPFNNPDAYQWYLCWWHYPFDIIPGIQNITGTWHILLDINGQRIDAPVEMRAARTPDFNRPPEPIQTALDPPQPTEADAVVCRVSTPQILDDLDYDVVRYHYVWRVNGAIVRDVSSAAQADMIPHHVALPCDMLECEVTPGDGRAEGPASTAAALVMPACLGDLDGDGLVALADLAIVLSNFGSSGTAGYAMGDLDCDGDVDLADLAQLLANFGSACG